MPTPITLLIIALKSEIFNMLGIEKACQGYRILILAKSLTCLLYVGSIDNHLSSVKTQVFTLDKNRQVVRVPAERFSEAEGPHGLVLLKESCMDGGVL